MSEELRRVIGVMGDHLRVLNTSGDIGSEELQLYVGPYGVVLALNAAQVQQRRLKADKEPVEEGGQHAPAPVVKLDTPPRDDPANPHVSDPSASMTLGAGGSSPPAAGGRGAVRPGQLKMNLYQQGK